MPAARKPEHGSQSFHCLLFLPSSLQREMAGDIQHAPQQMDGGTHTDPTPGQSRDLRGGCILPGGQMPHPIWQDGLCLCELVSSSVKEGGDRSPQVGALGEFKEAMSAKLSARGSTPWLLSRSEVATTPVVRGEEGNPATVRTLACRSAEWPTCTGISGGESVPCPKPQSRSSFSRQSPIAGVAEGETDVTTHGGGGGGAFHSLSQFLWSTSCVVSDTCNFI